MKSIIITGGAGFIGSHVVREFVNRLPETTIVNVDALTYAGNLENLEDVAQRENYVFEKADITRPEELQPIFEKHRPGAIVHLAAESHVDRSITDPMAFVRTNVEGTVNLLNLCKEFWSEQPEERHLFYHISTDEVYGSLGSEGFFTETTPYDPQSPYSASKAASDQFVRAYGNTYGLPFVISNCSNNYGPNQFPEKLIPLCIHNVLEQKSIPVYGSGDNVRDWLFVEDHAHAIFKIFHEAKLGETYNIGGFNEWKNIDLIRELIRQMDEKLGRPKDTSLKLIEFVKDRPGHDKRYAIDAGKIQQELGWKPSVTFEEGLAKTIDWYLENKKWLDNVTSRDYRKYYERQYLDRE